jgi:hypothetical protein
MESDQNKTGQLATNANAKKDSHFIPFLVPEIHSGRTLRLRDMTMPWLWLRPHGACFRESKQLMSVRYRRRTRCAT